MRRGSRFTTLEAVPCSSTALVPSRAQTEGRRRATVTDLFVLRVSPLMCLLSAFVAQRGSELHATQVTHGETNHAFSASTLRGITGVVGVIRDAREHAEVTLSEVGVSERDPQTVTANARPAELAAPARLRTP